MRHSDGLRHERARKGSSTINGCVGQRTARGVGLSWHFVMGIGGRPMPHRRLPIPYTFGPVWIGLVFGVPAWDRWKRLASREGQRPRVGHCSRTRRKTNPVQEPSGCRSFWDRAAATWHKYSVKERSKNSRHCVYPARPRVAGPTGPVNAGKRHRVSPGRPGALPPRPTSLPTRRLQ